MVSRIIYDVTLDARLLESIRSGYFGSNGVHPRVEFGEFGTSAWWAKLSAAGVLVSKVGKVVELVSTGHGGNFPEFVFEGDQVRMQFERKGREDQYQVGTRIKLVFAKESSLFHYDDTSPYKVLEDAEFLLRVELVD